MKCTSCKVGVLSPSFIDDLFRAHTCTHCGGNWVLVEDYVSWKESNPEFQFIDNVSCEAVDTESALLCLSREKSCVNSVLHQKVLTA